LAGGGNSVLFGAVKIRPRRASIASANPVATWSEPIALEGWQQARRGAGLAVTFDWAAGGPPARDYTLFVHLTDASGKVAAQADGPPEGGAFPTSLWEAGDRITDTHVVEAIPAGDYRLSAGWYRPDTGQRLPLSGGGDELDLGKIEVPAG
jgi:hypothetical protein